MSVLCTPEETRGDVPNTYVTGIHGRNAASRPWDSVAWAEPPAPKMYAQSLPFTRIDRICRRVVRSRFDSMRPILVDLVESEGQSHSPQHTTPAIHVHDPRFYRRVAFGGSLGAAESYLCGEWSTDNLVKTMRSLARNLVAMESVDQGAARLLSPWRTGLNWLRRNTRAGSHRNIAAHYDLSNEFFSLMLDRTMTYSSGIFESPAATMKEASLAKYDRICRKLELGPADHVLEIGSGWGGFALYAASQYGCRVTTTTISRQQFDYAKRRIHESGLTDRIELLRKDYRDLGGQYDKLVSIEMIEAVGERFLDTFFGQCSRLLRTSGRMLLQAITMPDHRYDAYRRSVDFIQRYIFPGGFLPSFSAIGQSIRRHTDFRLMHSEDLGPHYAETLARWRSEFWRNIAEVRTLGFDARFIRMWHFYLCYCEAGFHERQVGVSQMLFEKPDCRRDPILAER